MARISYDEQTAVAYKSVREVPRNGLLEWRAAVARHLRPEPGLTVVDVGAGTGQFAAAFTEWFDVDVVAVEPSDSMRAQIAPTAAAEVLRGDAMAIPVPGRSVDAAWMSLVLHHIPDLPAAARELRRVLRPGAPVLIRQGFPDRYEPLGPLLRESIEMVRWFPETFRPLATFPTLADTRAAFESAGFAQESIEQVRETRPGRLADFLDEVDLLRRADTTMRALSDEEFARDKARLAQAVADLDVAGLPGDRSNWLDLLVLR